VYTFTDQVTNLVVAVYDTNCASIGDYKVTITGSKSTPTFDKISEFYVRISKDCRCNIVTKTSTDIVDRTSSDPVIIYFDEQTLSLPETFSFAMPACVASMSYTLTQQITTLGDTSVVSLTVNPDKLTITLQAVYKVDTYAALDKKTVTVTIVATDTECNCPVSDSFTLYFLHVCHTATITP